MNFMRSILTEMRTRPGMWLGECTMENLHVFMNGYMHQLFHEKDIIPEFYPGFQEYIEKKYDVTTGQHWSKILDFYANSEEDAMKKFFLHLDEYTKIDENRNNN